MGLSVNKGKGKPMDDVTKAAVATLHDTALRAVQQASSYQQRMQILRETTTLPILTADQKRDAVTHLASQAYDLSARGFVRFANACSLAASYLS